MLVTLRSGLNNSGTDRREVTHRSEIKIPVIFCEKLNHLSFEHTFYIVEREREREKPPSVPVIARKKILRPGSFAGFWCSAGCSTGFCDIFVRLGIGRPSEPEQS